MKLRSIFHAALAFNVVLLVSSVDANETKDQHPIVAGFERFIEAETVSEVERGLLLINELNCGSCHSVAKTEWAAAPRIAPILTEVGSRVQASYLEKFLSDPHGTKPGTTMPDVLGSLTDLQRKETATALAHFLATTGKTAHTPITPKEIRNGERLFHSVGCVACHNPQNEDTQISTSVPLGNLGDKYTVMGLTNFLANPLHARPSGRMPELDLSDKDVRQIAAYLMRDVVVEANINYAYYEGAWDKLPDFDSLQPKLTGTSTTISASDYPKKDNFGLVFTGYWELDRDVDVKFLLESDDGSKLIINGETVIDNDGIHGMVGKDAKKKFGPGVHEVRVEFFEKGGGEEVHCWIEGDGFGKQSIGNLLRKDREPPALDGSEFKFNAKLAERGRKHFESLGCANCHELEKDGARVNSTFLANKPNLAELNSTAGCVSGTKTAAQFNFSEDQQLAIAAAMKHLAAVEDNAAGGTTASSAAENRLHQHMMTLNCYTCHTREIGQRGSDVKITGGVTDPTGDSLEVFGRYKWFTGTEGEMGDEGRIPPGLKLVGAKLNDAWLSHVLIKSSKDRPYMNTMMPKFGEANVKPLIEDFKTADVLPNPISVTQTETEEVVKTHGRYLTGGDALGCIKCHTFGKFPSTGFQALSLTTMTKRLDKDWFQSYMHKPSDFRRGTRMPEGWPQGKSFYTDILDGDVDRQIDAVWQYLSDGEDASRPRGLLMSKMEIVAKDQPVMYRNFIEGAGSRAIGVGYPEGVNLAFDANTSRLAMIWQENFMDASRHWTGRGQGFEPPLGIKVIQLPESVAFRKSPNPETVERKKLDPFVIWPDIKDKEAARKHGLRFKGYRFEKDRSPVFTYNFGPGIGISDHFSPLKSESSLGFSREIIVTALDSIFSTDTGYPSELRNAGPETLHPTLEYRVAAGKTIVQLDDGWLLVDGQWKTRIVELSSGSRELKLPSFDIIESQNGCIVTMNVPPTETGTVLRQEYQW